MSPCVSIACAVALVFSAAALAGGGAESFVRVDEVRPGDVCVGKTVFAGTTVEEFEVEIVGVVPGVAPGSDIIIGRARGETLERTGILLGMSGSPVYRDGRLLGAIAGTWAFSKEPLAAITPIEEMLPALESEGENTSSGPDGAPLAIDLIPEAERERSAVVRIGDLAGLAWSPAPFGARQGSETASFGVPLVVSGGDEELLERLGALFAPTPLVPVRGSSVPGGGQACDLVPGSAVGVQFVGGDMTWAAMGTVTHRDGDRVLAFGHPIFNSGAVELPMVGGYVHALVPLSSISFKYASGTDPVGTVYLDRRRVVAGRVGPVPSPMPLLVDVRAAGGATASYRFDVVRARPYGSFFAGLATAGAVSEAVKATGPALVSLKATLHAGGRDISYAALFQTDDPSLRSGGELAALIDILASNRFESVEVDRAEVEVTVAEGESWCAIERVAADRAVWEPGDVVAVTVVLGGWQGQRSSEVLELRLPESTPDGPLILRVGDATSFHDWSADRLGDGITPRTFAQLVDLIETSRPGNVLVAEILSERPGLSLSGREVSGFPGTAALAVGLAATSGVVDAAKFSVVAHAELALDREVRGFRELEITVRRGR